MKIYDHLALGGTFDLLHAGHKALLKFAFEKAKKVSVGITTDEFASRSEKYFVKNLSERKRELESFLASEKLITRSRIVLLRDVYGSTLKDETIQGLIITEETKKGGLLINQKRGVLRLNPLELILFPIVHAADGLPISTSRIRRGLIDREGFSYLAFLTSVRQFILPNELRGELSRIHGKLMSGIDQVERLSDGKLITVGDEVTVNFIKHSMWPDLAVVDFRINRKDVFHEISDLGYPKDHELTKVKNEHGTIDGSLIEAISKFFANHNEKQVIKVDGEEDLAVLPVVLLAPLGTQVFYGQPNQGLVLVEVTEAKKNDFLKILQRFKFDFFPHSDID